MQPCPLAIEPSAQEQETTPRWAQEVVELSTRWHAAAAPRDRERLLGELWRIVGAGLERYVRLAARKFGALPIQDMREVVADKGSELFQSFVQGQWNPGSGTAAQVCAYLAAVARHGVADRMSRAKREVPMHPELPSVVQFPTPGCPAEAGELAQALVACARSLTSRARVAWYLRLFHEMPSTEIARHPGVNSTPPAVDAMLLRCRALVRDCMQSKGLAGGPMPGGTFVALWEATREDRAGR